MMGMMAYAMGGGLYAHSISYILTLEKGLPHGAGCGFALPFTLALNEPYVRPLLDQLAARCLGRSGDSRDRFAVIRRIRELYSSLSMPVSLQSLGYREEEIPRLAEKMMTQYSRSNNPRAITQEDACALFRQMYLGEIRPI